MSVQYRPITSVASSVYVSSRQDSKVSASTVGMVCGTTSPPSGASPSSNTSEKLDGSMPPRVDTYFIALVFVNQIANLDTSSRPGPTPTPEIRTPASFSSAEM